MVHLHGKKNGKKKGEAISNMYQHLTSELKIVNELMIIDTSMQFLNLQQK